MRRMLSVTPRSGASDPSYQAGRAAWTRSPMLGVFVTAGLAVVIRQIANARAAGFEPDDLFAASALVGLGGLAVMLRGRRALVAGAGLVATWLVAHALYDRLPGALGGSVPVGDAVGAAAYFRDPYIGLQLTALVLILATGAVAALLARRRPRPAAAVESLPPEPSRRDRRLVALATALVVLTLLPDLHDQLVVQSRGPLDLAGWDDRNLVAWDFFLQRGLQPMVDFFFPYGNGWVFHDFPFGPAAMFSWQALWLSVAAWALSRLIGPRPWRIALCLLAIVALGLLDLPGTLLPQTFWRYMPGFTVALAYAAAGPLRHRQPVRAHGVLLVACAVAGAMAFDVFTLALGGILFVAIGEIARNPAVRGRRLVRAAAVDVLPVIGGAACMLASWALAGTFDANLRWYGDARGVSAYSGAPHDKLGALLGLTVEPGLVLLLAAIPALLLVVAFAYGRLAGRSEQAVSAILFAAAGVSAVILAKHMVRAQGPLVLYAPLIALGLSATVLWTARSVRTWFVVALFAGTLGSVLHVTAQVPLTAYATSVVELPVTIVRDVRQIADRDELRDAANDRFAAKRFARSPEKTRVADPLERVLSGAGDRRFAVLGDAQLLYVLFDQKPPLHTQLYNASPKAEQRAVIGALQRMAPAHLVWRRDVEIDGVPYPVRVPLVFAYAIEHYVPERLGNPSDLLRPRRRGEAPALAFWRARLGESVDLGAIPSYSRGAQARACDAGPGCVPYAAVTGTPAKDGERPVVDVRAGRRHFKIALNGYAGVERYSVRLDRLWFWPFVAAGARLSTASPGWRVRRVDVRAGDDLY